MSNLAKEIGFYIISIFLVGIPFLTGVLLGMVGELGLLTIFGLIASLTEAATLTVIFLTKYED